MSLATDRPVLDSLLRLFALRPLLTITILGVPLLALVVIGLFTVVVLKLLLFVVLPIAAIVWLARRFWCDRPDGGSHW
jgi:type IV secretory pathway VirB3-like protein